jgi:hypothetical protein
LVFYITFTLTLPNLTEFSIEASAIAVRRCAAVITKALGSGELRGIRRGKRTYNSRSELDAWAERKGLRMSGKELATLALRLAAMQKHIGMEDAA